MRAFTTSRARRAKLIARGMSVVLIVAVACVAAVTGAGAAAGGPGASGSEEAQAPAPWTTYAPATGAAMSDSAIAKVAKLRATTAGDGAATMTAVDTTFAASLAAQTEGPALGTSSGISQLGGSGVVVVTMRGHFKLGDAAVPRGRHVPAGSVLTLIIDAHTGWVDVRELSNAPLPGIAALGQARTLE
jgi:hypothetical protein